MKEKEVFKKIINKSVNLEPKVFFIDDPASLAETSKALNEPTTGDAPSVDTKLKGVILEANAHLRFGLDKASEPVVHTEATTALKTASKQTVSVVQPNFFVEESAILELKPLASNYPHFVEAAPVITATTAIKNKSKKVYDGDLEPKSLTSYHQFGLESTNLTATTAIKAKQVNERALEPKPLTSAFLQYGVDESVLNKAKLNEGLIEPKPLSAGLLFSLDDLEAVKTTKTVVLNEGLEPKPLGGLLFGLDESGIEVPTAVKIAEPKLCGGWGGQAGYGLDGCVETGLLRPPQPHSSQLGTVYATKRRRRNGKR